MPIRLDALRLAAALAHSVPDTRLRLTTDLGVAVEIGRHTDADLGPCQFRQAVAAGSCPGATDCSRWIGEVSLDGALGEVRGPVHRYRPDGAVRVFATTLHHDVAAAVVAEAAEENCADAELLAAADARVVADPMLGVSVVFLRIPDTPPWVVDRLADDIAARCLVAELIGGSDRAPRRHQSDR